MSLKAKVADLGEIAEPQRGLYVEDGEGGYRLDLEGGLPDPPAALSTALAQERKQVRELKAKLRGFEIDGKPLDPAAYATALAELEELKSRGADAPADDQRTKAAVDRATRELAQKVERITRELDATRQEAEARKQRLVKQTIERALLDAAAEARVQEQFHDDVKLRANLFTMLDDETVVMLGPDGQPQTNEAGGYVIPKDYVTGLTKTTKVAWVAPSQGAGARGTGIASPGRGVISRDDSAGFLANVEQIAKGKVSVQ